MAGIADQIKSMLGVVAKDSSEEPEQVDGKTSEEIEEKEVAEEAEEKEELDKEEVAESEEDEKDENKSLSELEKAQAQIAALTAKLEEVTQQTTIEPAAEFSEAPEVDFFTDVDWEEVSQSPEHLQAVMKAAFDKLSTELRKVSQNDASVIAQREAAQVGTLREYARNFFTVDYPELGKLKSYVLTRASQIGKENEGMKLTEAMDKAAKETIEHFNLASVEVEKDRNKSASLRTPRGQKKSVSDNEKLTGTEAQIASMLKEIKNI